MITLLSQLRSDPAGSPDLPGAQGMIGLLPKHLKTMTLQYSGQVFPGKNKTVPGEGQDPIFHQHLMPGRAALFHQLTGISGERSLTLACNISVLHPIRQIPHDQMEKAVTEVMVAVLGIPGDHFPTAGDCA